LDYWVGIGQAAPRGTQRKMVLVVNTSLKMDKGKISAQTVRGTWLYVVAWWK
jgi:peptidyl-tRNA hydrolase